MRDYPFEEGDVTVIGPECFAARDGSVLSWRGENYVPQRASRWHWVLPVLAVALVGALVVVAAAQAATRAQFDTAKARVKREAQQGIKTYDAKNTRPEDGCCAAFYKVWGTTQAGDTVTFRWRIRYYTPTKGKDVPDWTIRRGRVTVRGPAGDRSRQRAALATDGCVA